MPATRASATGSTARRCTGLARPVPAACRSSSARPSGRRRRWREHVRSRAGTLQARCREVRVDASARPSGTHWLARLARAPGPRLVGLSFVLAARSTPLDLLAQPLDLALQPLDGRRERCRGGRGGRRDPELAVRPDDHRLGCAAERRGADPGDERGGLRVVLADPDRPRLAGDTGVGDSMLSEPVVRFFPAPGPSATFAFRSCSRTARVGRQRRWWSRSCSTNSALAAGGDVAVRGRVREQRLAAGGDVGVAAVVGVQRLAAARDVVVAAVV